MFIIIEGIDGAGCETQAKLLSQKLQQSFDKASTERSRSAKNDQKENIFLVKYPHYETPVGKMIREFLYQNKDLTAEQQFLLYCLQFVSDAELIKERRKKGIVIADRYFTTALCYQTLEGIDLKTALRFADDFKIEKPDMVFYLNVDPEIAIKRKLGEQKEKNRREKDITFIHKTYKQYDKLVKEQVWTKWVNIDGNRSITDVAKQIFDIIKSNLKR